MFGLVPSAKWIAVALASAVLALFCAGGWVRAVWIADARLTAAVAARDSEWGTKLDAANARADLLAATQDVKALQAAQAARFQLSLLRKANRERTAELERALANAAPTPETDPIVFPRAVAKAMRR